MQVWSAIGPLVGVVVGAFLAALFQWRRDSAQAKREYARELRQASRDTILESVAAAQAFKLAFHAARVDQVFLKSAAQADSRRDLSTLAEQANATMQSAFEAAARLGLSQQKVRASVSLELAESLERLRRMVHRAGPPDDPETVAEVATEKPWLLKDENRETFDLAATVSSLERRLDDVEAVARHLLGVPEGDR